MKIRILPNETANVIGIDPSLTHTGIVVLSSAGKLLLQQTIKPKTKGTPRLIEIVDLVEGLLIDHQAALVVMEGYGYSPHQGNLMGLGELGGVLKTAIYRFKSKLLVVAPLTLKKFATGSGKGDKNQIILKVYRKYGIELDDDHQTDAFILAQIGLKIQHLQKYKTLSSDTPRYEKEVLTTILEGKLNVE